MAQNIIEKLYQLMKESVITQSTITILLIATVCYLAIVGRPIPETIVNMTLIAIGFFFGSKFQLRREADYRTFVKEGK